MNESESKIRNKIMKALALAGNNPSEKEAATALLKAQELLAKYNLSFDDIKREGKLGSQRAIHKTVIRKKMNWWEKELATIIADNFRCFAYLSSEGQYRRLVFLGAENDVEVATEVYCFACECVRYHSQAFLNRKEIRRKWKRKHAFKNDYIRGYLSGLQDHFYNQLANEGLLPALIKPQTVQAEFDKMKVVVEGSSFSNYADSIEAQRAGYRDGKRFNQNRTALDSVESGGVDVV